MKKSGGDGDPGFLPIVGPLLVFAGVAPAMGLSGYWPTFDFGVLGGLAVSVACGALGGSLIAKDSRIRGAAGGTLAGLLIMLGVFAYTAFIRNEGTSNLEIAVVAGLCGLPGAWLASGKAGAAAGETKNATD